MTIHARTSAAPVVGIVIAAYNSERMLPETLDSVLAQDYQNWECVVVDDGSKDSTYNIASEYADRDPRIRSFRKNNGGVSSARNYGCARLSGSVSLLSFLDHDDLYMPHGLKKLVAQ